MPITSVGVDFDDFVVDTFSNVHRRTEETAKGLGLAVPSRDMVELAYDYALEMAQALFPKRAAEFAKVYETVHFPYEAVDGAREALQFLSDSGVRLWIFTGSSSRKKVEKRAGQAGIDPSMFHDIITGEDTKPYKKPEMLAWKGFAHHLKRLGIKAEEALYFDDSIHNYQRAREVGLQPALLLGSPNSRGYEGIVPPEDLLPSVRHLPEFAARRGLVYRQMPTR